MLTLDGPVEVLWVQAYSQRPILLMDDYHRADSGCWLLHWTNYVLLLQIIQCVLEHFSQQGWHFWWCVLHWVNPGVQSDAILVPC